MDGGTDVEGRVIVKEFTNRKKPGSPHGGLDGVQPLFVIGLPRSGTTLTAQILGRHAQILAQGETHFFEELRSGVRAGQTAALDAVALRENARCLYQSLGRHRFHESQARVHARFSLEELEDAARSKGSTVGAIYRAFIELQSRASSGERYVCDDTPRHLFQLPAILSWFPKARIVACVRDPRDFLCSYKNYWKKTSSEERTRIRRLYHPILSSLYWRSGINALLKQRAVRPATTLTVVQYEALVREPETTVAELCAFLGLAYDPEMLDVGKANSSFAVAGDGIFTESVGRWKSCLEPAEAALVQSIGRSGMESFGYQLDDLPPARLPLLRHVVTTPIALAGALWSNRERTGQLMSFLIRRTSGIFKP